MRRLIAVATCHKYRQRADIVRHTWAVDVGDQADVRFFFGRDPQNHDGNMESWPEEVHLEVPDDYDHFRHKVQAIFRWAVEQGYDYVLKTDDDVVIFPDRLFSTFQARDYAGRVRGPSQENVAPAIYGQSEAPFCSGFGYWLSRRAAEIVASAPDNGDWAEDRFAGQALNRAGIQPFHLRTHLLWPPISGHFCSRPNTECGACWAQYNAASVICPYARPIAVAELYRWYKEAKQFIPTWLA